MDRLRGLYGNNCQNAVSMSDPLQGSDKNTMKKMSLVVVFEAGIPKLLAQIFPIALFNEGSKSGSNFLSFHDCFIHKQVTPLVYIGLSI